MKNRKERLSLRRALFRGSKIPIVPARFGCRCREVRRDTRIGGGSVPVRVSFFTFKHYNNSKIYFKLHIALLLFLCYTVDISKKNENI